MGPFDGGSRIDETTIPLFFPLQKEVDAIH